MELILAREARRNPSNQAPAHLRQNERPISRLQRRLGNHALGSLIQRCASGHT